MITHGSSLLGSGGKVLSTTAVTRPLRIPPGVCIRGVNTTSYNTTVSAQWGDSWSWPFMKRQLDNAVLVGANCVRVSGSVNGVVNGSVTLSDYLARWIQVMDYTQSLGLLAFPCNGGAPSTWLGDSVKISQAQAVYQPWTQMVDSYHNVIGINVLNEPFAQFGHEVAPDRICAMLADLMGTVRANTTLATSYDRVLFRQSQWMAQAADQGIYLDPLIDFVDVHVYYSTPTLFAAAADPAEFIKSPQGRKPIIIGEFGANMTHSSATRAAIYTAVGDLIRGNPKQIVGALAWAAVDTTDGTDNQWGLFSGPDNTERTDITTAFRALPNTR